MFLKSYKSTQKCLLHLKTIVDTYKLYEGLFKSPDSVVEENLKRYITSYKQKEICCICYDNCSETMPCKHYLCFRCRSTILEKSKKCPICRENNITKYYNECDDVLDEHDNDSDYVLDDNDNDSCNDFVLE